MGRMSEKFIPGEQEPTDRPTEADEDAMAQIGVDGVISLIGRKRKEPRRSSDDGRQRVAELIDPVRGRQAAMRRHPAGKRRPETPSGE